LSTWIEEGYAALTSSDFDGAIELFERAAAADPDYAEAVIGLSDVYIWLTGQEPRALELAQQAVDLAPDNAAAYVALSAAQRNLFAIPAALATAQKASELDAEDAAVQATLSRAYLADNQYEAALSAAQRAVELDPDLLSAYQALAFYYRATGDAARAQAAIERGLATAPDFAPMHAALGDLWISQARFDLAQDALDQAMALAPDNVYTLLNMAILAMEQGDFDTAAARIDEAAELVPDAPQPLVARGRMLRWQDENDDARAQLNQALRKRANYPPALDGIGWSYLNDGECDLAVRQFQTLMDEQPQSSDGLLGMGFARLCDDDPTKALEYLRKAVKLDPYDEWVHIGLGDAYAAQERWDEAYLAYAEALQVGLSDAQVHRDIGADMLTQEENDAARAEFELALQLNPTGVDSTWARTNLGWLTMSDGDLDALEAHAREALRLDPANTEAQWLLGVALVRQNETEEAIEVLEALVEEEPENAYVHAFLGLAYKAEERFDDAQDSLETYEALAPYRDTMNERLIEALDQGYYLTEAKATADLVDQIDTDMEREAEAAVIEISDLGRTLAITLTSDLEQEPRDVYIEMATAAVFGSTFMQRIEPAVPGGVMVTLVEDGETLFTMTADQRTAAEMADGVIDTYQFVDALEFKRTKPNVAQATVDEIKADVASTRALSATTDVPYEVLDEDALRERYEGEMDDEDRAGLRDSQAMMGLLGVIDPEVDLAELLVDLNAEQVSGFYSLEEKVFYLVDRGESTTDDQMTLAHEYVHALQDQRYDLATLSEAGANSDEQLAIRAFIEGDATLATLLYADEYIVLYDMLDAMSDFGGMESGTLESSPAFIRGHELFPYQQGLEFVSALHDRGDWEAVDEGYADLPRSTEQILHPERYRRGDDPVEVTLPELAGALGGAWQEVDREVMGELALRLYLQEHAGPVMGALAAEGWGGDAYTLLRDGDQGPYLLVMQTVWDDQEEADQFLALYRVGMSHRAGFEEEVASLTEDPTDFWWRSGDTVTAVLPDGKTVRVVIGPDTASVEAVLAAMEN
jgi:tetratricopeptide (TPR) repeat protein